ncbi:MAG TPA: hypothetical protein VIF12_08690 [Micavibrio sp.]
MIFKEEDFPLYQHLLKLNEPEAAVAKSHFEAAVAGGFDEQVYFAIGIQGVAANVPLEKIPGSTKQMMEKTLQTCLKVFKEAAAAGHEDAIIMVQDFEARGLGKPSLWQRMLGNS